MYGKLRAEFFKTKIKSAPAVCLITYSRVSKGGPQSNANSVWVGGVGGQNVVSFLVIKSTALQVKVLHSFNNQIKSDTVACDL